MEPPAIMLFQLLNRHNGAFVNYIIAHMTLDRAWMGVGEETNKARILIEWKSFWSLLRKVWVLESSL